MFCICRYISYPRTETNMFPDSFDLHNVVEAQTVDHAWGGKVYIILEYLSLDIQQNRFSSHLRTLQGVLVSFKIFVCQHKI